MTAQESAYGSLVRVSTDGSDYAEVLRRVPLASGEAAGSVSEARLQELLFRYPATLPIEAIDPAYAGAVPICTELKLPAGWADALYVNRLAGLRPSKNPPSADGQRMQPDCEAKPRSCKLGRLTLAEFKLWRNPQARREVIGQILDYAKDLASWGYEDLQRQVALATGNSGNVVYDLVRERAPDLDEAEFVDNVARHLRRGDFLLLIVGDGIREDAEHIVDFVQKHSGLHFNVALVEAALYRDTENRLIIQPRVLARTELVQRFVSYGGEVSDGVEEPAEAHGIHYDQGGEPAVLARGAAGIHLRRSQRITAGTRPRT